MSLITSVLKFETLPLAMKLSKILFSFRKASISKSIFPFLTLLLIKLFKLDGLITNDKSFSCLISICLKTKLIFSILDLFLIMIKNQYKFLYYL